MILPCPLFLRIHLLNIVIPEQIGSKLGYFKLRELHPGLTLHLWPHYDSGIVISKLCKLAVGEAYTYINQEGIHLSSFFLELAVWVEAVFAARSAASLRGISQCPDIH
jgi:hypothetical protein